MDLFFLSWSFDSRWMLRIKNPCYELIFTIPFIINSASLIWAYIEKSLKTDDHLPYFVQISLLLGLLAISNLYMICVIRMNSAEKMAKINENYVAIEQFYHDYETKKLIWSRIGLIITILAICQTIFQGLFLSYNKNTYPCYANTFRYYFDLGFYFWILANILVFILFKAVYLFFAWVCCPGVYLKIKKIID